MMFLAMTPFLMISYEAPPRLSAYSILTGKLLKALGEAGGENPPIPPIDLVCASAGTEVAIDPKLQTLYPDTVIQHQLEPIAHGRTNILKRILGGGWQASALTKSAALFPAEHKKPALLYSRSHPPGSHLAALALIEGALKGVPWVAHFTEPLSRHPYYKRQRAALSGHEHRIFELAKCVVFSSQEMSDATLAEAAPEVRQKSRIIPPNFDASLYLNATLPADIAAEIDGGKQAVQPKVSLAHVGTLLEHRSPEQLVEELEQLARLHPDAAARLSVLLAGRIDTDAEHAIRNNERVKNLRIGNELPYFESLALMKAVEALLVIEPPAKKSVLFPSKLVDYLGAEKPILGIAPKDSFTAKLLAQWNQICCDNKDVDGITAALKRLAEGNLWPAPDATIRQAYSAATVGKQMADLFASVTVP